MKTIFIEESNKKKVKALTQKEKKIIINKNVSKMKLSSKIKLIKKIISILSKEKTRQVVLSKNLKEDKDFVNLLYSYNINICSSKWLFKELTDNIIEDVLGDKKKEQSEIWICVNDIDILGEDKICKFAKEFRKINIITNHISKFRKITEKLYQEEGILINLTNNRRKALIKANLIFNVDFPREVLNQFAIYDKAVIVNLEGDMNIKKKRFEGKIINNIDVEVKDDDLKNFIRENNLENFNIEDICQVMGKIPEVEIIL